MSIPQLLFCFNQPADWATFFLVTVHRHERWPFFSPCISELVHSGSTLQRVSVQFCSVSRSDTFINHRVELKLTYWLFATTGSNFAGVCWHCCCRSYRLPKRQLIDVPGKHGAGWEDRWVCGRHDRSRHRPQTKKGDVGWAEVLEHYGKDHVWFIPIFWRQGSIRRLVPGWKWE